MIVPTQVFEMVQRMSVENGGGGSQVTAVGAWLTLTKMKASVTSSKN